LNTIVKLQLNNSSSDSAGFVAKRFKMNWGIYQYLLARSRFVRVIGELLCRQ